MGVLLLPLIYYQNNTALISLECLECGYDDAILIDFFSI